MNLVLPLSIILVTQLPLYTFGKSPRETVDANTEVQFYKLADQHEATSIKAKNNDQDNDDDDDDELRTKRNSIFNDADYADANAADDDDDDILINKLSREYVTSNLLDSSTSSACNNWNDNVVDSDMLIEKSLRSLFDVRCLEGCRLKVLSDINEILKCVEQRNRMQRDRRSKWDVLNSKDDLFIPVRGRRFGQAPPRITAEKKGQLDVLANDLFLPSRGKHDAIELSDRDYFVPNRGKRLPLPNHIVDEESKSGIKVIIPKSHTPFERDPWLFGNINSDDRNMIDLLRDLNQPGIEANKDIKAKATATTTTTTTTAREKFIPRWNNEKIVDKTAMIFNPTLNDEFTETFKTPDGAATNLIFTNTPHHHDDPPNGFTSRFN